MKYRFCSCFLLQVKLCTNIQEAKNIQHLNSISVGQILHGDMKTPAVVLLLAFMWPSILMKSFNNQLFFFYLFQKNDEANKKMLQSIIP